MYWTSSENTFRIWLDKPNGTESYTKRQICLVIASIFDPLAPTNMFGNCHWKIIYAGNMEDYCSRQFK